MEQDDLLRTAVGSLERLGLRYFVTGSMATIFYGEPRFTNDIDIVVDLPPARIIDFCAAFPAPEYYLSEDSARQAVARHSQFNIIHPASGLKIDVMVPDESAFNQSRFARRNRLRPAPGFEASFAAIEDVILKKLEYYREGGSDKHLRDIASMLKVSGEAVDRPYLEEWAERLGVADLWQDVAKASDFFHRPGPRKGSSILQELLEERRDSR